MSEVELAERLDQAIQAILRGAASDTVDASVTELAAVAAELRDLPSDDFRKRLQAELQKEAEMSVAKEAVKGTSREETPARSKKRASSSSVREGFRAVTPYIVVSDVHQEIDFIKQVFGAKGKVYGLGSQGGFHSEYRIGDSMLMIGGGGKGAKWQGTPVPASLHTYVPDVDGAYQRAIEAGATSLMPPTDLSYGERGAAIEDAGGNHWYVATAVGPSYVPEGLPDVMPYFNPRGARRMIQFFNDAFAAEELFVHESPDGVVQHAKMRIGESIVEMGEAHGPWQPRPMHFMVYVDNCDAAYARAMKAEGAVSVGEPADAPYGGRTGTIQDPFGNTWYLTSQSPKKEKQTTRQRR